MQGASTLYQSIKKKKLKIAISIVPKTISNDIPLFDTYFGFESCIEVINLTFYEKNIELIN